MKQTNISDFRKGYIYILNWYCFGQRQHFIQTIDQYISNNLEIKLFLKHRNREGIYHLIKCENITKFKPPDQAICENNTGYGTRGNIPIPHHP